MPVSMEGQTVFDILDRITPKLTELHGPGTPCSSQTGILRIRKKLT